MKDRWLSAAVVCVCACFLLPLVVTTSSTAADVKLGQISLTELSNKSTRIKAAIEDLQKVRQESTPKMAALTTEINKIEEDLKKGKDTLKPEEQKKLEADLNAKVEALKNEQQSVRVKLSFKQKSLQNVVRTQIAEILGKLAKEEGLTAVLLKDSFAYTGPDVVDVTEKVTKAFDAMPPLEKGPEQ